uniref:Uncharacterized protein n=1 Tax=Peronospora matthiolae TaxID=2874970 RepID=A0AAV1TF14_9STRA
MDTDKELFIEQLVAALRANSAPSSFTRILSSSPQASPDASRAGSSSDNAVEDEKSTQESTGLFLSGAVTMNCHDCDQLAQVAYAQLQYDFPNVSDASIEALAELYRRITAEKSTMDLATEVPVTTTLLDGIAFLNSYQGPPSMGWSSKGPMSSSNEASGLLAASLLLRVFRMCLEIPDDARVNALLSLLVPEKSKRSEEKEVPDVGGMTLEMKREVNYVEKFAAQEDPDDLSEVYEGHLPDGRMQGRNSVGGRHTAAKSAVSRTEQLQYLASQTFSSSFESVSIEKWEQWRLDDDLVAIMKLLVYHSETEQDRQNAVSVVFYGVHGDWTRYLYVLRDRIMLLPSASRNALLRLKELIEFFHRDQSYPTAVNTSQQLVQPPQHLVYCVLAELAMSSEFHQGAARSAQQGLAMVVQELLPLIVEEIHQHVSLPNDLPRPTKRNEEKQNSEDVAGDDGVDGVLVAVILQLLHFTLFASSSARTTAEKFYESGVLRTLLMILPPKSDLDNGRHAQCQDKRWFSALLRFVGECALWHAGFATYLVRVPKFIAMLPMLRERFVVEELLLALAFYHHEVTVPAASSNWNIDVWTTFTSESVFPMQCDSYAVANKKLQDAVFLLDCLEKVLANLTPTMQKELQCSLQQIYAAFRRSFEYPTFVAVDAVHHQQQLDLQETSENAQDIDAVKKREDRSQVEALQFTALRNKLRQSVKSLLAALSLDSTMTSIGGRVSSKLD